MPGRGFTASDRACIAATLVTLAALPRNGAQRGQPDQR